MSRFLVLACVLALVTAAAIPAATAGAASESADPFAAVAGRSGVPAPLLAAIGYTNTHWKMYGHQSQFGGWGMMQLTEGPGPRSLRDASTLTGASLEALRRSATDNLLGGAFLLRRVATPRPSNVAGWAGALSAFGGPEFQDEVFLTLRNGADGTLWSGGTYHLAAQSVTTPAAAIAYSPDNSSSAWVPASPSNYTADFRPYSYPIQLVVIHVTEASYASAINTFKSSSSHVSAHYVFRSQDGASTQMVREHDIAWHAGNWDYNTRAIGIEHEGYVEDSSWFTAAMYQASARLVAQIVSRYSIPIDREHIVGHDEVPDPNHPGLYGGWGHHTDPGPYWNWAYYLGLIHNYATPCRYSGASAFSQLPGLGYDVAVNHGSAWVIGKDVQVHGYGVWHWTGTGWTTIGGAGVRIAVDPQGLPWVIDMNQDIHRWDGSAWQAVTGWAYDIGIGADGSVWVLGVDNVQGGHGIWHWNGTGWDEIPGGGVRIAVDAEGQPWVIADDGTVWRHLTTGWWVEVPGQGIDIGIDAGDSPWVIGMDRYCGGYGVWSWSGSWFSFANGSGEEIAGNAAGHALTLTNNWQVWQH